MKVLLLSDIHASDKAPASCTDSYPEDILDLLRQTVQIASEREVAAVVWAGDVFHSKAPSRVSHRLVQQLIEVIRNYPCPCYIVVGNHDVRNDRLESVHETQPLGVLFRAGARKLEGWEGAQGAFELPLYGVPWLGYCGDDPERQEAMREIVWETLREFREWQARPGGVRSGPCLVVTHAPLYPPGQELKYEYFPAEWWADAMGMKGYVFYGHVHEPHGEYGFYDADGGVTFCNNGALSRGSLHEYNLTRDVGCTLWDSQTGGFEFISLDAKPADQVFRLQEKQQEADVQGYMDQFLEDIGHTTLEVLSPESVLAHVRTLGLGKAAEDLAEELLAEAAHARADRR